VLEALTAVTALVAILMLALAPRSDMLETTIAVAVAALALAPTP
jgi:hypothetical protein